MPPGAAARADARRAGGRAGRELGHQGEVDPCAAGLAAEHAGGAEAMRGELGDDAGEAVLALVALAPEDREAGLARLGLEHPLDVPGAGGFHGAVRPSPEPGLVLRAPRAEQLRANIEGGSIRELEMDGSVGLRETPRAQAGEPLAGPLLAGADPGLGGHEPVEERLAE